MGVIFPACPIAESPVSPTGDRVLMLRLLSVTARATLVLGLLCAASAGAALY